MTTTASCDTTNANVMASFSIIKDFVCQIGNERIELTSIICSNSGDMYEPTPADVKVIAQADIVLINGLMFEELLARLIEANDSDAGDITLTDNVDVLQYTQSRHNHFIGDKAVFHAVPQDLHAWQSVSNALVYVSNVAQAFYAADAAGCSTYEANQQRYSVALVTLDGDIRERLSATPEARRTAVVAHHAFRYFENECGLTFLIPQGISTESEAGAVNVASLIDALKTQQVSVVFDENTSSLRLVEQIATEVELPMGSTLYSDALSGEMGTAATYEAIRHHNATTLVSALLPP